MFTGTRKPTAQHSDYIVLAGGAIECTSGLVLGDHSRVWVAKGGKFNISSCRPGQFTKVMYEDGAILDIDAAVAAGKWRFSGALSYLATGYQLGRYLPLKCPKKQGLVITGILSKEDECKRECHNGGFHNATCTGCIDCDAGYDSDNDCETCSACENGEHVTDGSCRCLCDEGWGGISCDVDMCVVNMPATAIPAAAAAGQPFVGIKQRADYVVSATEVFHAEGRANAGSTSSYSDVLILPGGRAVHGGDADCSAAAAPRTMVGISAATFSRYYVAKGGQLDARCVTPRSYANVFYEDAADITWPAGGERELCRAVKCNRTIAVTGDGAATYAPGGRTPAGSSLTASEYAGLITSYNGFRNDNTRCPNGGTSPTQVPTFAPTDPASKKKTNGGKGGEQGRLERLEKKLSAGEPLTAEETKELEVLRAKKKQGVLDISEGGTDGAGGSGSDSGSDSGMAPWLVAVIVLAVLGGGAAVFVAYRTFGGSGAAAEDHTNSTAPRTLARAPVAPFIVQWEISRLCVRVRVRVRLVNWDGLPGAHAHKVKKTDTFVLYYCFRHIS